jgi:hypothetical protein
VTLVRKHNRFQPSLCLHLDYLPLRCFMYCFTKFRQGNSTKMPLNHSIHDDQVPGLRRNSPGGRELHQLCMMIRSSHFGLPRSSALENPFLVPNPKTDQRKRRLARPFLPLVFGRENSRVEVIATGSHMTAKYTYHKTLKVAQSMSTWYFNIRLETLER